MLCAAPHTLLFAAELAEGRGEDSGQWREKKETLPRDVCSTLIGFRVPDPSPSILGRGKGDNEICNTKVIFETKCMQRDVCVCIHFGPTSDLGLVP